VGLLRELLLTGGSVTTQHFAGAGARFTNREFKGVKQMNTFVLILTLYTSHGVTIYSVPGFTQGACAYAATNWSADIEKRFNTQGSAVCAKQD
jgi:hypothetical protein